MLARTYVKGYYNFVVRYTNILSQERAYLLFEYAIKSLYNLETCISTGDTLRFGKDCIDYLSKLKNTPRNCEEINFEDRVHLVDYCSMYFLAVGLVSRRSIENARVQEVVRYSGKC